ncbi:MAG: dTMP kinase [Eubacterium sp.]|nr:dTMP kinase [Eubacterium sp.]
MNRGYFITFEGPDGAGKSTQIEYLKEYLDQRGLDSVFTREPGGTRISEQIRDMLLDKENTDMSARTEALLYAASRAQLVEKVIQPALDQGKIVVSDRYFDSSIAYQGFGRDLGPKVLQVNKFAVKDLEPDLTFLMMISPDDVRSRLDQENLDRLESEDLEFKKKVLEGFESVAEEFRFRVRVIDATLSKEEIRDKIIQEIEWHFKKRGI